MNIAVDRTKQLRMLRPGLIPERIWNALLDLIGSLILRPGPGYRIKPLGFLGYTLEILSGGGAAAPPHPLSILDASVMATPKIRVTPGNIGGYGPTIGGASINVKTGMPLAYPTLTVATTDTMAWIHVLINSTDGSIDYSGSIMDIASGTSLPDATATDFYLKISDFTVAIDSTTGYAKVTSLDNNLFFSQAYGFCGIAPTTDMTSWGACYQYGAI